MDPETYLNDRLRQDAVERCFINIAEAVIRLRDHGRGRRGGYPAGAGRPPFLFPLPALSSARRRRADSKHTGPGGARDPR